MPGRCRLSLKWLYGLQRNRIVGVHALRGEARAVAGELGERHVGAPIADEREERTDFRVGRDLSRRSNKLYQ